MENSFVRINPNDCKTKAQWNEFIKQYTGEMNKATSIEEEHEIAKLYGFNHTAIGTLGSQTLVPQKEIPAT